MARSRVYNFMPHERLSGSHPWSDEVWVVENEQGEDRAVYITASRNNDLIRYITFEDLVTDEESTLGCYTDEQLARIKRRIFSEMEVLAWIARG